MKLRNLLLMIMSLASAPSFAQEADVIPPRVEHLQFDYSPETKKLSGRVITEEDGDVADLLIFDQFGNLVGTIECSPRERSDFECKFDMNIGDREISDLWFFIQDESENRSERRAFESPQLS